MFKSKDLLYHSIAILTVIIWGTTFVSTKILINTGLSPVEILLYRFVLAYFCILTIAHRRLWANCVKDEFLLFLSGLCGGSLYFIAENTALGITLASNVSLLICTEPIITTVLSPLFTLLIAANSTSTLKYFQKIHRHLLHISKKSVSLHP